MTRPPDTGLRIVQRSPLCYEMLLKSYYYFLSILSFVLLDLFLSGGFILFLMDIFHLITIWSCRHYYKIQGWAHGKHMSDTYLSHGITVHYCAMLCAQPFILYYSFLSFNLHSLFISLTNHAFHLLIFINPAYFLFVISFTHCICIFDS